MSPKIDYTEDIRFFREAVSSSITPLLQQLEKELIRISSIAPMCHEQVAIKLFGKEHYKDPRFVDYIKADAAQWLQLVDVFLKFLSKEPSNSYMIQTESRLGQFRRREEQRATELKGVISDISGFLHNIQGGFILDASIEYAKQKKCVPDDDKKLPSREDIVPYLDKILQTDVILGDRIITSISKQLGPQFRDYLLRHDLAEAEACLPAKGTNMRLVSLEVAALQSGLASCLQVYLALNKSIEVCKRIDENYYIKEFNAKAALPEFPSTSYDAATIKLEQSQDQWSKEEYLVIQGREQKEYTFLYTEPQNGEYFPGLRRNCWYAGIIEGIASELISRECIAEQDKDRFMYLFFGYGAMTKLEGRLYWKDKYDSRKKDGTVRHPSELYYLLEKLYCNRSVFNPSFVSKHLEFSPKTEALINDTLSKGNLQQMAQRCNQSFQKCVDQIIDSQ